MLKKFIYGILTLMLISCSGEKYDISNAINILPEREDELRPDFAMRNIPVMPYSEQYYKGDFIYKELANLDSINSNFEIENGVVYYVNNKMELVGKLLENGKTITSIKLISKGLDVKKSNIKYTNLALNGQYEAVVSTNFGHIFYIDLEEKEVVWKMAIQNIIPLKPLIFEDDVFIFNASGGLNVYNKKTGALIFSGLNVEDQTGINFESVRGLEPKIIPSANLLVSYYRGDLLFFDIRTRGRFTVSLIESVMNFGRITSTPIISHGGIFTSTTINFTAFSYFSGGKIWSINGTFNRSFEVGDFLFTLSNHKNLVAIYKQNGKVKFNIDFPSQDIFLAPISSDKFFAINSKGEISIFNINTGDFIEKIKRQVPSENFNYRLINGKIYYTNRNKLILLN